jgi:hypothetical protein
MSLDDECRAIRTVYVLHTPRARLNIIRERIEYARREIGASRLITTVSAVEALARSIVVNGNSRATAASYDLYKRAGPVELVPMALALFARGTPAQNVGEDVWQDFATAVDPRNLIVHECTQFGQDKWDRLIGAAETVLDLLTKIVESR